MYCVNEWCFSRGFYNLNLAGAVKKNTDNLDISDEKQSSLLNYVLKFKFPFILMFYVF